MNNKELGNIKYNFLNDLINNIINHYKDKNYNIANSHYNVLVNTFNKYCNDNYNMKDLSIRINKELIPYVNKYYLRKN